MAVRRSKEADVVFRSPAYPQSALDERDGYTSGARTAFYHLTSELATHASPRGVMLMTTGPKSMAQVGPFFDEQKLRSWLGEMALRLSPAALRLLPDPDGRDMRLLETQRHYLRVFNKWWSQYRGTKPLDVP